ncbi:hypothetical protein [Limnoglobus roseus]|nr:hypothetical protein [Limnoglobus roseus]
MTTDDGSDQWTGRTLTFEMVSPAGAQITVEGTVLTGGAQVLFRKPGPTITVAWPLGSWTVDVWSAAAGSRDWIDGGTMIVERRTLPQ